MGKNKNPNFVGAKLGHAVMDITLQVNSIMVNSQIVVLSF